MSTSLKTKLTLLVNSGIPSNSTLVSAEDAKYILKSWDAIKELQAELDEADELQAELDEADECHFDECISLRAQVADLNNKLNEEI